MYSIKSLHTVRRKGSYMSQNKKGEVKSFRINGGKTRLRLIENWGKREDDFSISSHLSFLSINEKTTIETIMLRFAGVPFFGIPELRQIKYNPSLLSKDYWINFRQGNHIIYFLGSIFEDISGDDQYIPYLIDSSKNNFILRFAKTSVYVGGCISPVIPHYT